LNVDLQSQKLIARHWKKTLNTIAKPKSFQNKQIVVFMFHVMLIIGFSQRCINFELHKFWFCHDDLMRCVGRISRNYAFDKLALLSLWLVQVGTNFIQIESVALEEVGFLFSEKPRCPLVN
jgi:hypothetical protein